MGTSARETGNIYLDLDFDAPWRQNAACRDSEYEMFFPPPENAAKVKMAALICEECVVKDDCLEYALETNQEFGVWGGLSEGDRRNYRRRWLVQNRR